MVLKHSLALLTLLPVGFWLALSLVACVAVTDPTALSTSSPTGHWSGTVGVYQYDVQLAQQDSDLTGAGGIGPPDGSMLRFPTWLVNVTGTFRAPQVRLTFWSQSTAIATFSGVLVAPDVIRGVIQRGGTSAVLLTLYRQGANTLR